MKQNARKTVAALIAKAVNNENIDEARNAALQACRLIDKHKLLESPGRNDASMLLDVLDDMFAAAASAPRPPPKPPTWSRRPPPPPEPIEAVPSIKRIHGTAYCDFCKRLLLRGQDALLLGNVLFHFECFKQRIGHQHG